MQAITLLSLEEVLSLPHTQDNIVRTVRRDKVRRKG